MSPRVDWRIIGVEVVLQRRAIRRCVDRWQQKSVTCDRAVVQHTPLPGRVGEMGLIGDPFARQGDSVGSKPLETGISTVTRRIGARSNPRREMTH